MTIVSTRRLKHTTAGDLLMRQEMQRVNTMQPALTGDELIAQVMGSRSDLVLTRWLERDTLAIYHRPDQ